MTVRFYIIELTSTNVMSPRYALYMTTYIFINETYDDDEVFLPKTIGHLIRCCARAVCDRVQRFSFSPEAAAHVVINHRALSSSTVRGGR